MKKIQDNRINPIFAVLVAYMLGYFLVNDLNLRYIYVYLLLGVMLLIGIFMDGVIRPRMKIRDILFEIKQRLSPMKLCFLFLSAVIAVYSVLPNSDLDYEIISTTISMLVLTAYLVFSNPSVKMVKKAFAAIYIVAAVFSIYSIYVRINPAFYWRQIFPLLGSYTQERALFLMPLGYGVPIGGSTSYGIYVITIAFFINIGQIYLYKGDRKLTETVFLIAGNVLYLTAILLFNRRSEMLSLLGTLLVVSIIFIAPYGTKELKHRLISFGSTILLMVCVVVFLAQMGYLGRYSATLENFIPDMSKTDVVDTEAPTVQPVTTEPSATEPSATEPLVTLPSEPEINIPKTELSNGRFTLWKSGWSLFTEKPVVGIGWMQFRKYSGMGEDYVHNTYIQWLCEVGMIGFILIIVPILIMLTMTLAHTIRLIRNCKAASFEVRLINFVALSVHGYFLALSLVDPTFYHLYFFVFYSFIIILADTALCYDVQSKEREC